MKSIIPAELRPDQVTAIQDTREQLPLDLHPLRVEVGCDSTPAIIPSRAWRPSSPSNGRAYLTCLACIGTERERFDREVQRLLAYPVRCLIVESTWAEMEAGEWRSKVTAAAAIGSLLGWVAMGIPVIMAGDHERAGRYVSPAALHSGEKAMAGTAHAGRRRRHHGGHARSRNP